MRSPDPVLLYHKSGMEPKLVIEYEVEPTPIAPLVPVIETTQICDTTGQGLGCALHVKAKIDDPDDNFPLTSTFEIRSEQGGNED